MKKQKQYEVEFKRQTVQYIIEEKKSLSQVSKETGIAISTLSEWYRKYHPHPQEIVSKPVSTEKQQWRESQKRVKDLEEEVAILKKAMAIFTKDPR